MRTSFMSHTVMIPTKQYGTDFALHDFHFITEDLWEGESPSADVSFKIRHTDTFMKGILTREDDLVPNPQPRPFAGYCPRTVRRAV